MQPSAQINKAKPTLPRRRCGFLNEVTYNGTGPVNANAEVLVDSVRLESVKASRPRARWSDRKPISFVWSLSV